MTYVGKVKTPLMITHGERDFRVNIQQGETILPLAEKSAASK